ncbi:serine/threonine-protein kinase [Amycolatopsis sp. 195334CR]|uniref:serine/threonine-protein kinase n=1 Tax=Amycolatopsis sp. 195334CR TaxID=2814588 RepID=UPI001A8F0888|nr:serine/threonine-protein kinase [Amycolatopsis sp. 195334CR]MBN6035540.1 serine/threonine protein kinase [Amycolatopsis sp. 195334CR]
MTSPDWMLPGFTEVAPLGAGSFGRVVLARHDQSGTEVAIKYLYARYLTEPEHVARFREEARQAARVISPHVAKLHEFVERPEGAAIVMEAVPGVSLKAVLAEGPLEPEAALAVLKGSLLGLAAAHAAGTVHRDYKPDNVLVGADRQSKLVDFGLAVLAGSTGVPAGTPAYMAPEQWSYSVATPSTDVYAATCVFFQSVTGERPYAADDSTVLRDLHEYAPIPFGQAPEPIRELIKRGMAKKPEQRPANAAEFVSEVEQAARAGYGEDWENRGLSRLAGRAAALMALSPVAMLAAAAQLAPATGAMIGSGTATTVGAGAGKAVLGTTAGKVIAGIATLAVLAGAGAAVIIANQDDDPAPPEPTPIAAPAAQPGPRFTVQDATREVPDTAISVRVQHGQVTGLPNADLERKVNEALRQPDERFGGYLVSSLGPETPSDSSGTAQFRMQGPRLVSLRHDFTTPGSNYAVPPMSITVDLETGEIVEISDFLADVTDSGAEKLQERIAGRIADCPDFEPFSADSFRAVRSMPPVVQPIAAPDGLDLMLNLGQTCGVREIVVPYAEIGDLLNPEFAAKLPPGTVPATPPTPKSSSKPSGAESVPHTVEGAAIVLDRYFHGVGAKNTTVVCEISAPAWDDESGSCPELFQVLFDHLSPQDLAKAKAAKTDPGKLRADGPNRIIAPPSALVRMTGIDDQDGFVLEWRQNTWLIVD